MGWEELGMTLQNRLAGKDPVADSLTARPRYSILCPDPEATAAVMHYQLQWAASSLSDRAVDHTSWRSREDIAERRRGQRCCQQQPEGKRRKSESKELKKEKKKGAETMKRGNPKHFTWINSDSKSESGPSANQRQAWVMMSSLKPSSVTDCFWFCGGKGWSSVLILI